MDRKIFRDLLKGTVELTKQWVHLGIISEWFVIPGSEAGVQCLYTTVALCREERQPWSASAGRVRGQANLGLLHIPRFINWNVCRRRHPRCHGDTDAHVPGENAPPSPPTEIPPPSSV